MADEAIETQVLSTIVALVTAWTSVAAQGRIATQVGITIPETDIRALYTLGRHGCALRPAMLADELQISRPTMSKMISRLKAEGLVARSELPLDASSHDGRGALVTLTPTGLTAYDALVDAGKLMVAAALEGTAQADALVVAKVMQRLVEEIPVDRTHPPAP